MSLLRGYEAVEVALESQPSLNLNYEFVTQILIDAEALMDDYKSVDKTLFCQYCA